MFVVVDWRSQHRLRGIAEVEVRMRWKHDLRVSNCDTQAKRTDKQDSIPVGCVSPASVATTRCQYQGGGGVFWVGISRGRGWVCPGIEYIRDACDVTTPNPPGHTHACENITFPQLPLWAVTRVGSHSSNSEKRFLVLVNFGGAW